jgi:hypothetical protein
VPGSRPFPLRDCSSHDVSLNARPPDPPQAAKTAIAIMAINECRLVVTNKEILVFLIRLSLKTLLTNDEFNYLLRSLLIGINNTFIMAALCVYCDLKLVDNDNTSFREISHGF